MSNNKQSSVEWLLDNLHLQHSTKWTEIVEQAKAMHKQENLQTWLHCLTENDPITFEEYYNETFNTKEK